MSSTRVKICGLKTEETLTAAVAAGAMYLGFNFFPTSPRYVEPAQARELAIEVPVGIAKVALTVDASDDRLDEIVETVPLDFLQLQGGETPERVALLRERYGLPIMKAVGIRDAEDIPRLALFEDVVDQLLVDAKPPKGGKLPGGNGVSFDWRLIAGRQWRKPWMLAGGLTAENVGQAIALTGARQVDVASGVETAPGVKDADKMAAFVKAAQAAA